MRLAGRDVRLRPERAWAASASHVVHPAADHQQPRRLRPDESAPASAATRFDQQDPAVGVLNPEVPDPCVHSVASDRVSSFDIAFGQKFHFRNIKIN